MLKAFAATLLGFVLSCMGVPAVSARFDLVDTYVQPEGRPYFGETLLVHGSRLYAGAPMESYVPGSVTNGAVYEIDLDALAPMRRIPAPAPAGFFGSALAVAGNTLFVGAPSAPSLDLQLGSLHELDVATGAFLRTTGNPEPRQGRGYGRALAVGGGRLVVAAPLSPAEPALPNVLYVYDLATRALERTIADPDGSSSGFGSGLLIVGDFLLASTYREASPGAVYVFSLATGAYLRTLYSPDADHANSFGWALASVGGLVAVGAPLSEGAYGDHGVVYLIDPATGDVVHGFGSPLAAGVAFGEAVVALGDLLVVGARADAAAVVFDVATGSVVTYINQPSTMGGALAARGNEVFVQAYRAQQSPRGYAVLRYASTCGNGVLDPGELCDDGNLSGGDGCTPDCRPGAFACAYDLGIARAALAVRTPAHRHGGASLIASGRFYGSADAALVMTSVLASGVSVSVRDAAGHALLDLTERGAPIPGEGHTCGPRDGWRSDPARHVAVYTNRSGALPPTCAPGSAQGLRRLALHRPTYRDGIDVRLEVSGGAFPSPAPPIDLIVKLGGPGDHAAIVCGSRRFDAGDCVGGDTREALRCRSR